MQSASPHVLGRGQHRAAVDVRKILHHIASAWLVVGFCWRPIVDGWSLLTIGYWGLAVGVGGLLGEIPDASVSDSLPRPRATSLMTVLPLQLQARHHPRIQGGARGAYDRHAAYKTACGGAQRARGNLGKPSLAMFGSGVAPLCNQSLNLVTGLVVIAFAGRRVWQWPGV